MLKVITVLLFIFQSTLGPVAPPEIWATPIPDFETRHSRDYQLPAHEYGAGHRGIDLSVKQGEEVKAPFDGVVSFVGLVANRKLITIHSLTGYKASFEPVCSNLEEGEFVREEEILGWACAGEKDYEEHCENCVHFSVRSEQGYLNPLLFVGQLWPSVLVG
jgi:murein DD-endopeptidase MepM/ murein hydrolase activator NlpD